MRMQTVLRLRGVLLVSTALVAAGCGDDLGTSVDEHGRFAGDGDGENGSGSGGAHSAQVGGGTGAVGGGTGGVGGSALNAGADAEFAVQLPPADPEQAVGINPFVLVAHDPFSTFAADVDTASYDLFLRDVAQGRLPAPDSVRLEEFVNYFHYDYPKPAQDAEHPFAIDMQAAPNPLGRETVLLRVGVQARDLIAADHSQGPANIVFLADVSGSMQSEEKLPLVQRVMHNTLDDLSPGDNVAIVTYASGVGVRLASTPLSERSAIEAAIDGLSAGGSTNGAGGIQLAYQEAEAGRVDGINHVVLLTDGDFNVGANSDAELVALIEDKRRSGITLTVLGFGSGALNDSMMEKVSNAGNGIYGVITGEQQADDYVSERMLSTLVHAAKDMKLQVEFNPEHVHAYRLLGYENRDIADQDFRNDAVDAGEVGSGHQVTALYELVMAGREVPPAEGAAQLDDGDPVEGEREIGAQDMVLLKVRYKDPADAEPATALETNLALASGATLDFVSQASSDMQWAVAVAGLAEILRQSPYSGTDQLQVIGEMIDANVGDDDDRLELQGLLPAVGDLL